MTAIVSAYPERLEEEGQELFTGDMIGGDAHDEEARGDVGCGEGMHDRKSGITLGDDGPEVGQDRMTGLHDVPHGILHPRVGDEYPDCRDVRREGDEPDAHCVKPRGKPFPAQGPGADKGRFQKKGDRGFYREEGAENVSDIARVSGPVGPELEFQGKAGDHSDDEVEEEEPAPEPGHLLVLLLLRPEIGGLHDGKEDGETEGQGHEEKMKISCYSELKP